ncbi:HD domain-containing protein [Streptomyces lichenis]|uniref:Caspase family protein n=1 Tax=Streptomyces lichenis TaxID=2306967 RepID=A0ABT0IJ44_9ACTN|nr:caspase family protein [Streptomyces lichenis]MCK8681285.1 caspase family protein [Streptomyces lichenis]
MAGDVRRALLIGVGHAPAADGVLEPLDEPVTADLHSFGASLRSSGYEVEILRDPARNEITQRLYELSEAMPPDGTLLLHFTGHGVRIGTADYLLPADARAPQGEGGDWGLPYIRDSLLPADISPYLAACQARTVIWLIDACLDGVGVGPGADPEHGFGSRVDHGRSSGQYAVLTGCGPGERSGYGPAGSHFTSALAYAFGDMTPARTLDEVYEAVRVRTGALARRAGNRQTPAARYGRDLEPETRATVVCEGRRLLESWQEAVAASPVWDRVRPEHADAADRLRERIGPVVEAAARTVHLAQQRMPDPWADDDFPVRLLRDRLPLLLPKEALLTAVEAAALVVSPFLHEAAWARRLSEAVDIDPDETGPLGGDEWRRLYEQVLQHHREVAERMSERHGRTVEERDGVRLWLVHRWIAERFEIDDVPVTPSEAVGPATALLGGATGTSGRAAELAGDLAALAAALTLGAPPAGDQEPETPVRYPLDGCGHQVLRLRPLAELLRLAAVLALDVRTLPEVVAEHLAVTDRVLPQDVINLVREAAWDIEDGALHLDAVCPHMALHAALLTVAEEADERAARLGAYAVGLPAAEAGLLAGVPARVTARRLRPAGSGEGKAYQLPLLRFQLAQTEVRRLLMGEQLYGGRPELALRELYQNALDACRYRGMRWRYLRGCGGHPSEWTGAIAFTQGEDERGRYVECVDNGVGMDVELLKSTFTRAGRRFEDSRSFRHEQAAWLRHDRELRLYPNSRFGIGVFSYFMLADEMTVVTRPVAPDGSVARQALRVDIASSGSLFRIREVRGVDVGLPEGGTRVRLYLREEVTVSCVAVLREHVLVSEYALTARDGVGGTHEWVAAGLQAPEGVDADADWSVEAVPGVLWWVDGEGAILCDGIRTDRKPFGYVLNLTGAYAGRLTVDRQTLQSYDEGWVEERWQEGASALEAWPGLRLDWLWELEEKELAAAVRIWPELYGKGLRVGWRGEHVVPNWPAEPAEEQWELDVVGCFWLDGRLEERRQSLPTTEDRLRWIRPWRRAALGRPRSRRTPGGSSQTSLAGYPVPTPAWSSTLLETTDDWRSVVQAAFHQDRTVGATLRTARALRVQHPRLAPPGLRAGGDLEWRPDARDAEIMAILSGRRFGSRQLHGRRYSPDDLRGIAFVSHSTGMPLGPLLDTATRYQPFLSAPVPVPPAHHRDHVCDADEVDALFAFRNGPPVEQLWDLLRTAQRLDTEPEILRRRLAAFDWLGWTAPSATSVERWAQLPDDLLSVLAPSSVWCSGGRPSGLRWRVTVDLALLRGMDPCSTEEEVMHWAELLNLEYTRVFEVEAGRRIGNDRQVLMVLSGLAKQQQRLDRHIGLPALVATQQSSQMDWIQLADAVELLRSAGFDLPATAAPLLRGYSSMSMAANRIFSDGPPNGSLEPVPGLPTTARLFGAAISLRLPLDEVWATALATAEALGVDVPSLPPLLADLRPEDAQGSALLAQWMQPVWRQKAVWAPLTAARLTRYARSQNVTPRHALDRLTPLRELGALVPDLTEVQLAALPATEPDERDETAVSPEYRVSDPGSPLVPLDLVSVAARLGEPVSTTWRRIEPYLPFEAAPPALPAPEAPAATDVLPLWQDLIVLSRHADGMLPALEGKVTDAELAFAAVAVGEGEAWVRGRLELYAALFGLRLPEEGTGT